MFNLKIKHSLLDCTHDPGATVIGRPKPKIIAENFTCDEACRAEYVFDK